MFDRSFSDYWTALYRRRYAIVVVVLSSTVFAWALSKYIPPRYEAEAIFYVPSDATRSASDRETPAIALPTGDRDGARAQGAILHTHDALARMHELFPDKSANDIGRDLDIVAARNSLISVYVRDKSPVVAADMANSFITLFNDMSSLATARDADTSLQKIEAELTTVSSQLEDAWNDQRGLENRHSKLPDVVAKLNSVGQKIDGLKSYQSDLRGVAESLRKKLLQPRHAAVVVQQAEPPAAPVFPVPIINAIVACIFGLVVGIFYAFILDYMEHNREVTRLRRIRHQQWAEWLTDEFPLRRLTEGSP